MRGNPTRIANASSPVGSIPAYAGEPCLCTKRAGTKGVYPRVCGGTKCRQIVLRSDMGLSPRMRGNRGEIVTRTGWDGSIPAYAGEPVALLPR